MPGSSLNYTRQQRIIRCIKEAMGLNEKKIISVTNILIAFNFICFIIVSWQSGSLLSPRGSPLFAWGAKDSFMILEGEYWRYVTPIFLHIGIVHFLVNNYSLKVLGPHAEQIFGPKRFILIYVLTGIAGNIASAAYQPYPSAGASGALFGILGSSFWFELALSRSSNPLLARTSMVKSFFPVIIINLCLGLMVPMIDQAAHLGGLISGVIVAEILLNMKKNMIKKVSYVKGIFLISFFTIVMAFGVYCSTQGIFFGLDS